MLSLIAATLGLIAFADAKYASITPHDKFSSSVGVLGCKIDTNSVAYFPGFPPCDTVCMKVSANGREKHLLHIDQSGGAFDISYDAWNYLSTGQSALVNPTQGGGFDAQYEYVDMSNCAYLLKTGDDTLPLQAANSIGWYVGCAGQWVGQHASLWNIANSVCTLGYDERCTLDLNVSNQPSCPHTLGLQTPLTVSPKVADIAYGTGQLSEALQ